MSAIGTVLDTVGLGSFDPDARRANESFYQYANRRGFGGLASEDRRRKDAIEGHLAGLKMAGLNRFRQAEDRIVASDEQFQQVQTTAPLVAETFRRDIPDAGSETMNAGVAMLGHGGMRA